MGPSISFQLMYRRVRDAIPRGEFWDGSAFLRQMEPEAAVFQRMHASTVSRQMEQDINQEEYRLAIAAANPLINPQQSSQSTVLNQSGDSTIGQATSH